MWESPVEDYDDRGDVAVDSGRCFGTGGRVRDRVRDGSWWREPGRARRRMDCRLPRKCQWVLPRCVGWRLPSATAATAPAIAGNAWRPAARHGVVRTARGDRSARPTRSCRGDAVLVLAARLPVAGKFTDGDGRRGWDSATPAVPALVVTLLFPGNDWQEGGSSPRTVPL